MRYFFPSLTNYLLNLPSHLHLWIHDDASRLLFLLLFLHLVEVGKGGSAVDLLQLADQLLVN